MSEMCVNCKDHPARNGDILCPICVISMKVLAARGIVDLGRYLGRQAEFAVWLRGREEANDGE